MSNSASDYEQMELRSDIPEYGPVCHYEWYDRDYRGLRLREPRIRMRMVSQRDGWQSPWIDAEVVFETVVIMREKRKHDGKQSNLPTNGSAIRQAEEKEGEAGG